MKNRATLTIPAPLAVEGDTLVVRIAGRWKESAKVLEAPSYTTDGGWSYRIRFLSREAGHVDIGDVSIVRVNPV